MNYFIMNVVQQDLLLDISKNMMIYLFITLRKLLYLLVIKTKDTENNY